MDTEKYETIPVAQAVRIDETDPPLNQREALMRKMRDLQFRTF